MDYLDADDHIKCCLMKDLNILEEKVQNLRTLRYTVIFPIFFITLLNI